MKKQLYISHVGPITGEVTLDLNRFNVFIGPQSNGKSTIAKLISTLLWMEKEACTTLSKDVLLEGKDFVSFVEDFHRIHNYFDRSESIVRYESDYVKIEYNKGKYSLELKDAAIEYKRIKVCYMPSDRNVVVMKDIEQRNLEPTNFRSFLFDWLEARRLFDSTKMADILSLDVKYYFDKERLQYQDRITHHNGKTYEISLYDASSGLQSAVPLVVLMAYLKDLYYTTYGQKVSFETQKKEYELINRLIDRLLIPYVPKNENETSVDVFKRTVQETKEGRADYSLYLNQLQSSYDNLCIPHSISYIIEEPEQNLFPTTQCDLTKYIIAACNENKHISSAVITTHSPYLLAMINNLILAGKLKEKGVDDVELTTVIPVNSIILPHEIGVYVVEAGTCKSIIDKQTGLINQNYLDTASENNAAIFDKLYKLYVKTLRK